MAGEENEGTEEEREKVRGIEEEKASYTNVRDEHVIQSSGLSSDLAVKIQPPWSQTP